MRACRFDRTVVESHTLVGSPVTHSFFTPYPKYLQIRELLLRRLARDLAPGDRLPTENALSSEFGVARETVREALSGLERDGLIVRRQAQRDIRD